MFLRSTLVSALVVVLAGCGGEVSSGSEVAEAPEAAEQELCGTGKPQMYGGRPWRWKLSDRNLCVRRGGFEPFTLSACDSTKSDQLFELYKGSDGRYDICVPGSVKTMPATCAEWTYNGTDFACVRYSTTVVWAGQCLRTDGKTNYIYGANDYLLKALSSGPLCGPYSLAPGTATYAGNRLKTVNSSGGVFYVTGTLLNGVPSTLRQGYDGWANQSWTFF